MCPPPMQLGGFAEKYAGSGVNSHTPSGLNKENRCTEPLLRFLEGLKKGQKAAPGGQALRLQTHS